MKTSPHKRAVNPVFDTISFAVRRKKQIGELWNIV